jgi:predicted hydrocarbon binding protein
MPTKPFRHRLNHDLPNGAFDDRGIRYMMIRPDALMGIFARLDEPARSEAFAAIAHSVEERGAHSARSYIGHGTEDRLLDIIAATAPDLGWGVWRFERTGEAITLTVRNSPFAAAAGPLPPPVCYPILGMLRGVSGILFGAPAAVTETACAAGGGDTCTFTAARTPRAGLR